MAASLAILTGQPKAAAKSYPTQPFPRFPGSANGPARPVTPGNPMDTPSKRHPLARCFAVVTSFRGVRSLPDGNLRGSVSPEASSFTLVPPTSRTRIRDGRGIDAELPPVRELARRASAEGLALGRPIG